MSTLLFSHAQDDSREAQRLQTQRTEASIRSLRLGWALRFYQQSTGDERTEALGALLSQATGREPSLCLAYYSPEDVDQTIAQVKAWREVGIGTEVPYIDHLASALDVTMTVLLTLNR